MGLVMAEPTPWSERSACRNLPLDLFFPEEKPPQHWVDQLPCGTCPVKIECGDYADRNNEQGIWGGVWRSQRSIANGHHKPPVKLSTLPSHGPTLPPKALKDHQRGIALRAKEEALQALYEEAKVAESLAAQIPPASKGWKS